MERARAGSGQGAAEEEVVPKVVPRASRDGGGGSSYNFKLLVGIFDIILIFLCTHVHTGVASSGATVLVEGVVITRGGAADWVFVNVYCPFGFHLYFNVYYYVF